MSSIDEHITIPSNVSKNNDLDFNYLRGVGQKYIEDLSRKIWTDYNIHDPGITIMELLCYAITDLGLRIDQPIENIVASPDNNFLKMHEQFKSAKNILTTKPVTALDYRKLFIDIDGVKNCWMTTHQLPIHVECNPDNPKIEFKPFDNSDFETTQFNVKGLYDILVEFEKGEEHVESEIRDKIHTIYHKNRNLCEDLVEIKTIPKQCIRVCAEIQLENEVDEELIDAKIQWAITEYLSPGINVYSLKEMLNKSLSTDEIFQGPILENGFIVQEELEKSNLRKEVRLSDIIKLIMEIDGVKLIEGISIDNCPPDESSECSNKISPNTDPWIICVENNHLPILCDKSMLKYKKGFIPVGIEKERVLEFLKQFKDNRYKNHNKSYQDLSMPLGLHSEINHSTIQHDLPENYGVSPYGLPLYVTNERRVQAKQLKGYLLFFDQVLSTYFSQLENTKRLLSHDESLQRTYFFKAVENIDGMEDLVNDFGSYKNGVENILGDLEDFNARRNKLLNHLISRFAEVFEDYSSAMYKLFGRSVESIDNNIIDVKNKFLKHYDTVSSERGLAFNYTSQKEWDTSNVSGFQKRIALLSGISNFDRRDLFNKNLSIETLQRTNSENEIYFEYRWKIKNNNSIILTSLNEFSAMHIAINDLLSTLKLAMDNSNFVLKTTQSGKFYVALKNKEGSIIGRQFNHNFTSKENAIQQKNTLITLIQQINFDEGFYLIENILTLPYRNTKIGDLNDCLETCVENDCISCSEVDPFSYQVVIVFPGYTSRFSNIDFRIYMENLIHRELPAHILARICWVGHIDGALVNIQKNEENATKPFTVTDPEENYELKHIQESWKAFLKSKKRKSNNYMASHKSTKELLCSISKLNTIYPNGTLYNCEDDDNEFKNNIILNRSALGSL